MATLEKYSQPCKKIISTKVSTWNYFFRYYEVPFLFVCFFCGAQSLICITVDVTGSIFFKLHVITPPWM